VYTEKGEEREAGAQRIGTGPKTARKKRNKQGGRRSTRSFLVMVTRASKSISSKYPRKNQKFARQSQRATIYNLFMKKHKTGR